MKKNALLATTVTTALLLCHVGCASSSSTNEESGDEEQKPQTALEMRALATIPLSHGGAVELVEVAPGVIAISETAPIGQKPIVTSELEKLDPEALFTTLSPQGAPQPTELALAFARRRERLATGKIPFESVPQTTWRPTFVEEAPPVSSDEKGNKGIGTTTQALYTVQSTGSGADRAAFIDQWCVNTTGDWSFCDVDRWGSHSRTRNDVDRYSCVGATFSRTATMYFKYRVWWDWTTLGRWTVSQGYWRKVWSEETGGLDYDAECGMSTKTNCDPFDYVCITSTPKAGFHLAGWGKY